MRNTRNCPQPQARPFGRGFSVCTRFASMALFRGRPCSYAFRPDGTLSGAMHCLRLAPLLVLMPFVLGGQTAPPAPDPTLDRIKDKMRQSLERIPNYTCLQTIQRERFTRRSRERKRKLTPADLVRGETRAQVYASASDTIRMEVAVVDGQELHSWPGAEEFASTSVADMVGYGSLSSGEYARHVRALFLTDAASFEFVGEEKLQGRTAVRYDYRVPLAKSEYVVRTGRQRAKVAHHGSLWADPRSSDLIRLTLHADDIPKRIKMSAATTEIDYTRVPIGKSSVLLPQIARLFLHFPSGVENRNEISYAGCRQFGAESVLSFGNAPGGDDPARIIEETEIPPGVLLHVRLETEIDSERSAVGDSIQGRLKRAVKRRGRIIAPEGALVTGRIRLFEHHTLPQEFCMIGLELSAMRFASKRARFKARLAEVPPIAGLAPTGRKDRGRAFGHNTGLVLDARLPGGAIFLMQGRRFTIRPGLEMKWKTVRLP